MSLLVGSTVTQGFTHSNGVSAAAIQAKISRYKQQLADCVNCPSSKTLQGKAKIQELGSKISTAEAHLEQISTSKTSNQPIAINNTVASESATHSISKEPGLVKNEQSSKSQGDSEIKIGRYLDIYI